MGAAENGWRTIRIQAPVLPRRAPKTLAHWRKPLKSQICQRLRMRHANAPNGAMAQRLGAHACRSLPTAGVERGVRANEAGPNGVIPGRARIGSGTIDRSSPSAAPSGRRRREAQGCCAWPLQANPLTRRPKKNG